MVCLEIKDSISSISFHFLGKLDPDLGSKKCEKQLSITCAGTKHDDALHHATSCNTITSLVLVGHLGYLGYCVGYPGYLGTYIR